MYMVNKDNQLVTCRGLLDTASNANFITNSLANKLGLEKHSCQMSIEGMNLMTTSSREFITAKIKSHTNNFEKVLSFCIIPHIAITPTQSIHRELIKIPANIRLADPDFYKPAEVDILISAGTVMALLSIGHIKTVTSEKTCVYFQKTLLGWIVGGYT